MHPTVQKKRIARLSPTCPEEAHRAIVADMC